MNSSPAPDLILFTAPGRAGTLRDVLDAAELRGDSPESTVEAPATILDDAAAESASEDWRQERNLIAGEELDVWLAQRRISHTDFLHHFRGTPPETPAQVLAGLWITGWVHRMALRHAHACAALAMRALPLSEAAVQAQREAVMQRLGGETALHGWLQARNRRESWWHDLCQLEAAHAECHTTLLEPAMLEKELRAQQFPLHRVRLAFAMLPSLSAAREMLLQLKTRAGASLADAVALLGIPCKEQRFFIRDLMPELQQPILSACAGECLEPVPAGERHQLIQIVEKTPPTLADPEVLRRVQDRVLEQGFADLCENVIEWRVE